MHKCPRCGQELEGNFCSVCGLRLQEPAQDTKACPKCGTVIKSSANFCPVCGYSYNGVRQEERNEVKKIVEIEEQPKYKEEQSGIKQKAGAVLSWIKSHLKIVIPVAAAILLIIILSCSIPACIKAQDNGTYYKLGSNGELDRKTYFILKSGKWTDEDGESGTYKKDGEKIVFYYTFFGETEELCDGTLKDKILTVNGDTYISEKHRHKYGEWETVSIKTCTIDGVKARSCACGVKETQTIKATGHSYSDWQFDAENHWKSCINCGDIIEQGTHSDEDGCNVCGYPFIYKINRDGTAYSVTGFNSDLTSCVIPDIYNDIPVTAIGNEAFYKCSSLTSITIPDSVTSIGNSAFRGCGKLTSITIPDSVTSIGEYAFCECSGLTSITIPDSVTSIGYSAFRECKSLTSITVAEGNSVYHSDGNCIIQTASKTLIAGCKNSIIPTDGSVTSIGISAFYNCSSLTSIIIPNGVTSIGNFSFYWCSGLTSITIPDGVTSIGEYAFGYCSGLTSITIPDSVTSIGSSAFKGCSSLIYNEYDSAYYLGNAGNSYLVLIEAKDTSITKCTINTNTEIICGSAFYNCSSLTSITIPDGVTSIGEYAFGYCSGLTSITIPDSVTSIGSSAFRGCSSLTSIAIPDSVTTIGYSAFRDCSSLTSINIPNSVTSIDSFTFEYCSRLTYIYFGGTAGEWNNIKKGTDWDKGTSNYTVYCTDGNMPK